MPDGEETLSELERSIYDAIDIDVMDWGDSIQIHLTVDKTKDMDPTKMLWNVGGYLFVPHLDESREQHDGGPCYSLSAATPDEIEELRVKMTKR